MLNQSILYHHPSDPPPTLPLMNEPPVMTPPQSVQPAATVEVQNNLGRFTFKRKAAITFPHGVVGFANAREFGLASLADIAPGSNLQLLQCLNEPKLSFIVLPRGLENELITKSDALDACHLLGFDPDASLFFFIITLRKDQGDSDMQMSLNVRAPVIADSNQRIGRQHVLSNPNYPVRMPLVIDSGQAATETPAPTP
jgi:flagellar assembly factor FliW